MVGGWGLCEVLGFGETEEIGTGQSFLQPYLGAKVKRSNVVWKSLSLYKLEEKA